MHGNRKRVFPMICIILAGGKGTRLQSVVTDVPKPLALVQGSPFLDILINNLKNRGIEGFIISVGYKKEIILEHYKNNKSLPIKFSHWVNALTLSSLRLRINHSSKEKISLFSLVNIEPFNK